VIKIDPHTDSFRCPAVTMYAIVFKCPFLRPKTSTRRLYDRYPRQIRPEGLNPVYTPGNFYTAVFLQAPPNAVQQMARYASNRRAGDVEVAPPVFVRPPINGSIQQAGTFLQSMFIGIGHANGPSITWPENLPLTPISTIPADPEQSTEHHL
jgi:hypothetical protein